MAPPPSPRRIGVALVLQEVINATSILQQNLLLLLQYRQQKEDMENTIKHILLNPPRRRTRRATSRKFWMKPGRTSNWWDNFIDGIVVVEDWKQNFRMSRPSVLTLCEELRPYIEGETTNMRAPIDPLKKVALLLYYLNDEGRILKTANAFGVSRQSVSVIIRQTCR